VSTRKPQPPAPEPPPLITVFATNGTRTSAGCGPGVLRLPPAEAARLVAAKLAVYGEAAPRNFDDGGQGGPADPLMEFR